MAIIRGGQTTSTPSLPRTPSQLSLRGEGEAANARVCRGEGRLLHTCKEAEEEAEGGFIAKREQP